MRIPLLGTVVTSKTALTLMVLYICIMNVAELRGISKGVQTGFDKILVRAECVCCPWLLAQTKVATIFGPSGAVQTVSSKQP